VPTLIFAPAVSAASAWIDSLCGGAESAEGHRRDAHHRIAIEATNGSVVVGRLTAVGVREKVQRVRPGLCALLGHIYQAHSCDRSGV
jgi:hypothetical protein